MIQLRRGMAACPSARALSVLICCLSCSSSVLAQTSPAGEVPPPLAPLPNAGAPVSVGPELMPRADSVQPASVEPVVSAPGPVVSAPGPVVSAPAPVLPPPAPEVKAEPHWYEKIKIRGYAQFRYSRLPGIKKNDDLKNSQGDRFLGKPNGFGIRRARLIVQGDVHDHVFIYLQPDFASAIDTQLNVAIMRDWYSDISIDKKKEFRFRVGQSKVPFGFENLQSSQNRLPLDRNDALNTAFRDERDLGIMFYWAPAHIRDRFKYLVDSGLKGSGDYGVFGLGIVNGQAANRPALSDDMTGVARLTWPFKFGEQFVEVGGGGYFGKYQSSVTTADGYSRAHPDIRDARLHGTIVVYPQPFGIQAEGNWGVGPSLGDNERTRVEARKLGGGYAQVMYKLDNVGWQGSELIPYARGTWYEGGKKFETNAPKHIVKELELGIEWQLVKAFEIVVAYDMAHRKVLTKSTYDEKGHVLRFQLQTNY
jgi:Phosphate-selective porin O and P